MKKKEIEAMLAGMADTHVIIWKNSKIEDEELDHSERAREGGDVPSGRSEGH